MNIEKAYVVFEPVNHVMKVVEAAKRQGFHVIVFRALPLTPHAPYAAAALCIDTDVVIDSWTDGDALMQRVESVCSGFEVVGSYAAAEICLPFEARFRERHGLHGLAPGKVAFLLDKERVRNHLRQAGLTRLETLTQDEALQMSHWPAGKAYFFKPVRGAGSALVTRCGSLDELRAAISNWDEKPEVNVKWLRQYIEADNRFFLEQAAEGELMSLEGFAVNSDYFALGLSSRSVLARDPAIEMGLSFPYEHPARERIIEKVRAIHLALGVDNGPTHTEIIATHDGEVELVELNIRFVGADVLLAVNAALQTRIEDQIVNVTLGRKPDLSALDQAQGVAMVQQVMPPLESKFFDSIEFPQEQVVHTKITQPLGQQLHSTRFQIDQIGAYIVRGASYGEALERADFVRRHIKVNGQLLGDDANNIVVLR